MLKAILLRIEQRLAEMGLTPAGASKRAGLNPDFIRDLRRAVDGRGVARHGLTLLPSIALARALDVNLEWLALGSGPKEPRQGPPGTTVPLISWVAAGHPSISYEDQQGWPLIATGSLPQGNWIALEVRGDSMDRVAPDGSIIFVNLKEREPAERGLFVFDINSETTFKQWRGGDTPQLAPISTNPEHLSMPMPESGKIIGRVRRTTKDW